MEPIKVNLRPAKCSSKTEFRICAVYIDYMIQKEIFGTTLSKELGDSRINRFVLKDADGVIECAVEEVVRKHYLDKEDFNNGKTSVIYATDNLCSGLTPLRLSSFHLLSFFLTPSFSLISVITT